MSQSSLNDIFRSYTNKVGLFKDKNALSSDFTPDNIPHREKQIEELAHVIAPVLRNEKPSNIFIYGKTGTGKSLCIRKVTSSLEEAAKESGRKVKIIYINCKMKKISDTEYRMLTNIISFFGENVPFTGLPTNTLYQKLTKHIENYGGSVIFVFDEIDALLGKVGNEILYTITRINQDINSSGSKITIIGISNKVGFIDQLDPRIRSSLSEEEMVFPPYNAQEIKDILEARVSMAFNENTVEYGAIRKCAALAAQENGDARKALDLLRVAAELCEREGKTTVNESYINKAQAKIDKDRVVEVVKSQPKHSKIVLLSMIKLYGKSQKAMQTGDVYMLYEKLTNQYGLKALTQRRVSDLISELDMLGVINASIVSKGRYGRTRKINLQLNPDLIKIMTRTLAYEFPESFLNV